MSVTLLKSLSELQPAGWDDIAYSRDLFAATPWLRIRLSDMDPSRVAFLGIEDTDRKLLAGLPAIQVSTDDSDLAFLKAGALLGMAVTHAGIDVDQTQLDELTMPSLLCGGHQVCATRLLLRAGLPTAETAQHTTDLVRAAIDRTAELGLRSTAFLHVDASHHTLRETLLAHGFAEFSSDVTYRLDLPDPTFDAYLAGLPTSRRYQVRRDLRDLEAADVRLGTVALPDSPIPELARLMVQWERKYDITSDVDGRTAYLHTIAAQFGSQAIVFTAHVGGVLAGFCLALEWKGHLYSRLLGYDYSLQRDLPLYFSTHFYQLIRYAEARGHKVIHYGPTSDQAKIRRGCTTSPVYGYVRCLDEADRATTSQICAAIPTR
jgi:predicted N-acyltransferase